MPPQPQSRLVGVRPVVRALEYGRHPDVKVSEGIAIDQDAGNTVVQRLSCSGRAHGVDFASP
jgi:hypothetical protein